jgi:type II secretory pathway pseudopilin PulG
MNKFFDRHFIRIVVASAIVGILSLMVVTGLTVRYLTVQSLEAQMVLINYQVQQISDQQKANSRDLESLTNYYFDVRRRLQEAKK